MIELGVEKFLLSKGYKKLSSKFGLISFVNKKSNLTNKIDGLSTFLTLILKSFYAYFHDIFKIGLVLDFKLTHYFIWNKNDFIKNHIDINGLKIIDENSIVPNTTAIGRLVDASGKLKLYDTIINENTSPEVIYKKIDDTYNFLNKNCSEIYLNEGLKIKNISKVNLPYNGEVFKKETMISPDYYYDGQITERGRPSDILKKRKPFTFQQFKNEQIQILVLASNRNKGHVESFLKKLHTKMKDTFHLDKFIIDDFYFNVENDLIEAYKKAIYENTNHGKNYHLVLTVIEESYKKLPRCKNPYYFSKAKLIGQSIPTQEITIEKIRSLNEYILNNIALSIYAKIGGTPWTIEKIEPLRYEIIVGIGSSVVTDENSQKKQVVGFATIFDYSGKYIVGDCSPISSFDDYKDNLKKYLISTISKIIKSRNIQVGDEIRIIFHLYKSAGKKREIYAIEEAINSFSIHKIEFALLHLNYHHNFKVFKNSGNTLPERGLMINTSENQMVLNFVSKAYKGTPAPLRIILDNRSTFKDLSYLAKQVFFFSFISFRSFNPSKKPITILYPSLLAKLSEEMKDIQGWDYDKLHYLGNKLWFL